MKNVSTFCKHDADFPAKSDRKLLSPRKQTLDFLTQFARVYQVESALDSEISGYILNKKRDMRTGIYACSHILYYLCPRIVIIR